MMRAEFFVFHYGLALLDALYTVKGYLDKTGLAVPSIVSIKMDALKSE